MRHFHTFPESELDRLFYVRPSSFTKDSDKELLASSLGATIYMPSTRPNLLSDIRKMLAEDATSVVVCLEDAIPDEN